MVTGNPFHYSANLYKKITKFQYPSKTFFMMDGTNHWFRLGYSYLASPKYDILVYGVGSKRLSRTRYWARHNRTINTLYLDGRANNLPVLNVPRKFPYHYIPSDPGPVPHDVQIFWYGYILKK